MSYLSFNDAWIFLGIKYAENENLDYYPGLVSFFNDINQSIPNYEEFILTYNKLLYLSVVKNENNKIYVSEFGNSIFLKALNKASANSEPRELVELIAMEFKPYKLKSACRQSPISDQEYDAAIKKFTGLNH